MSSISMVTRPLTVGIFLFDDVEVLDFAGPFEVFSVASRIAPKPVFDVMTISATLEKVQARHGLHVCASHAMADVDSIDILIVPGGVVTAEMEKDETVAFLQRLSRTAGLVASVCTGVFLLAKAGIVSGEVTTHWEDIEDLRNAFPQLTVKEDCRYIEQDNIITSAGISAGIEASLRIVERVCGRTHAIKTARQMDLTGTEYAD